MFGSDPVRTEGLDRSENFCGQIDFRKLFLHIVSIPHQLIAQAYAVEVKSSSASPPGGGLLEVRRFGTGIFLTEGPPLFLGE